jgi:hypothetical protein
MKMMNWHCILSAVVLMAMVTGCGKKESTTAQAGKSTAPQIADVQAWTLAKAFLKDQDQAKAEYDGKECMIRNLLAYMSEGGARLVSSCAFDPATKTISTKTASRYQGQDLVSGDEFNFDVEFADVAEFESIKDSASTTVDGKSYAVYEKLYSIQGLLKHEGSDNGLTVKNARLVK